jgi:hypothetical protein
MTVPGGHILTVGAAAGLLVLVAACGSSSTSSSPTPSAPPTGSSAAAPTAPGTASPSGAGTGGAVAAACATGTAPQVTGSGPSDPTGAGKAVATNFETFFSAATPAAQRVALLQNGTAYAPVLEGFAGNPLASKATVSVTAVDFTGPTTATVTFNLCESGAPALSGSTGKAVLEGGVWKVSDTTLCALVQLSGSGTPARCA